MSGSKRAWAQVIQQYEACTTSRQRCFTKINSSTEHLAQDSKKHQISSSCTTSALQGEQEECRVSLHAG
jgi:hypothetical protein